MNPVLFSTGRVLAVVGLLTVACERTSESETARDIDRSATRAGREINQTGREIAQGARETVRSAGNAIESSAESTRQAAADNTHPSRTGVLVPHDDHDTRVAAPGSGAVTTAFHDAVSNIASARCEREQRCNNVGAGKRYESLSACRTEVRASFSDDLNPSECRAGVDRGELRECLEEVRNENCGNPVDTLERVVACRTSDLCHATTVSLR